MAEYSFALPGAERAVLVRRVKLISWLSLAWMTAEGAIGLAAGIAANSVALVGYGLDSGIEATAGAVIIWRFTGARLDSETAETRARKIVAASFFFLAPYIVLAAIQRLATGSEARASWIGIGLACASGLLMPLFGRAKKRLAAGLDSAATAGESAQNTLCGYLSLAILLGLGANALAGLWWADPAVALFVAAVALQAGLKTWQGEACSDNC